jgi:hypothetical protein
MGIGSDAMANRILTIYADPSLILIAAAAAIRMIFMVSLLVLGGRRERMSLSRVVPLLAATGMSDTVGRYSR